MRSTVISALVLAGAVILGVAEPAAAAPGWPAPNGRCVDEVGVLGDDLCARITDLLVTEEKATSDEIAVAVVPTTGDATIESWSTGLLNAWGVGKKVKNNGVLLVVAVDDHRARLATGRGLAKRLSDATAKHIIDTAITPRFAEDEYAQGILAGLDGVRVKLGHKSAVTDTSMVSLAAAAAEPTGDLSGGEDPGTTDGFSDGEGFSGAEGSSGIGGLSDEGGFGWTPFACVGGVLLAMLGVGIAVNRGGTSSGGYSGPTGWSPLSRDQHHSSSSSDSGFSTTDTSSSSSSSDSSSSFGGGSSDGGGASGSW